MSTFWKFYDSILVLILLPIAVGLYKILHLYIAPHLPALILPVLLFIVVYIALLICTPKQPLTTVTLAALLDGVTVGAILNDYEAIRECSPFTPGLWRLIDNCCLRRYTFLHHGNGDGLLCHLAAHYLPYSIGQWGGT